METFFVNNLWKDHTVSKGSSLITFTVDNGLKFKLCMDSTGRRKNSDVYYIMRNMEIGRDHMIPLWLFGFLY